MIRLDEIRPNPDGRRKGLVPYRPRADSTSTVCRIVGLYHDMRAADALPLGPRTVGYRLKERHVGEYPKSTFPAIGEKVKRLQQAGDIPWGWVADASAVTYEADGWDDPDEFIAQAHAGFRRDRRTGQPLVVETIGEARETLPLIRRLGVERGVTVYSGGGSSGPGLAQKAARRALVRAVEHGQSTLFLGICDFDKSGIVNVLRPHIEHVSAFLFGTDGNHQVIGHRPVDGNLTAFGGTDATVSFRHLALTPEQAWEMVDDDVQWKIARYYGSGDNLWSRDADLLDGLPKIEIEALDPVVLRNLFVAAIDEVLDRDRLARVDAEEKAERGRIEAAFGAVSLNGHRDE